MSRPKVHRQKAQELLYQATLKCTRDFTVWPEQGRKAQAPTGEYYVEIVSGRTIEDNANRQGYISPADVEKYRTPTFSTPQAAIAAWEEQFQIYATKLKGEKQATLYWRIMPEIDTFKGEWKVYSRCLISNKPRLSPQPETDRLVPRAMS